MLELVVNNKEDRIHSQPDWMGPDGTDWLSGMVCGTEFLCRKLDLPRWKLYDFTHGGKLKGFVLLIPTMTSNDTSTWMWTDPKEFCKAFEHIRTLEVPGDVD